MTDHNKAEEVSLPDEIHEDCASKLRLNLAEYGLYLKKAKDPNLERKMRDRAIKIDKVLRDCVSYAHYVIDCYKE